MRFIVLHRASRMFYTKTVTAAHSVASAIEQLNK
jgi:hypothetical protein